MTGDAALIAAAAAVRANAYAPYSGLAVGAALLGADGTIHVGANCENASYPEGICAEAAAVAAMVAAGGRRIAAIAVVAPGGEPTPPCGGCRQKLAEFAAPETPILLATPGGAAERTTLGALLPRAFAAKHLPERR